MATTPACVFALVVLLALGSVHASSHSEAPGTAKKPQADNVDFYMFRSYEDGREDYTTFMMNVQPLQNPFAGPNYFAFSDQFFYILNLDLDGDAVADKQLEFYFGQRLGGDEFSEGFESDFCDCIIGDPPTTPEISHTGLAVPILLENGTSSGVETPVALKFIGTVNATDDSNLNWKEYYQMSWYDGVNRTQIPHADDPTDFEFEKPFDYAGEKTFGDQDAYESYARSFIHTFDPGNCSDLDAKVWVGQRTESFNINLGEIFDLVNFIPVEGFIEQSDTNNDLRYINVGSIVVELPTACIVESDPIIGAWSTVHQLCHDGDDHVPGEQVSRLGNPLVNELVIGLAAKKDYNSQDPTEDADFLSFVQYPSFPAILDILFRDTLNGALMTDHENVAPFNLPRDDLVAVFLTGIDGLNQPTGVVASEMMRLNTGIAPRSRDAQNYLGVIDSDTAGYPNGRRPGDDVVDITLRVAMGKLCHITALCDADKAPVGNVNFTDGAPLDATYFDDFFPYLKSPVPGSPYPGRVLECADTDCPDTEECPDCDDCPDTEECPECPDTEECPSDDDDEESGDTSDDDDEESGDADDCDNCPICPVCVTCSNSGASALSLSVMPLILFGCGVLAHFVF